MHAFAKWVFLLEVEALVDYAGMERANVREQPPYCTSGKSEARHRTPVPVFSMFRRHRLFS